MHPPHFVMRKPQCADRGGVAACALRLDDAAAVNIDTSAIHKIFVPPLYAAESQGHGQIVSPACYALGHKVQKHGCMITSVHAPVVPLVDITQVPLALHDLAPSVITVATIQADTSTDATQVPHSLDP